MDLENIMDVELVEPLEVEEQWWDLYYFTESNMVNNMVSNMVNTENEGQNLYNQYKNDRRKTISVITYIENLFDFENNSINSDSVCSNGNGIDNGNDNDNLGNGNSTIVSGNDYNYILPFKGNLFEKVNFQEKMKI